MGEGSSERLRGLIADFVAERNGSPPTPMADERDLFEDGLLDSFGFVELLMHLSEQSGVELDLNEVDPSELTTVGALLTHFAAP